MSTNKLLILLDPGHGLYTSGKRMLKSLDPSETREWVLNDRVADAIIDELNAYNDIEVIRLDDPSGKRDVPLKERVDKANKLFKEYEAKGYIVIILSVHHNAAINGGVGGGITDYVDSRRSSATSRTIRDRVYDELIATTGMMGNRRTPKSAQPLYMLYNTLMPGTLVEHGFMDSPTDVPVILSSEHPIKCAQAYVNFIVKDYGITKKIVAPTPKPKPIIDASQYAYVTASVLNVRNGRTASHKVIGQLAKGDRVKLLYLANGWWSIDVPLSVSDKGYAFISADWVSNDTVSVPIVMAPKIQYATVMAKPHLNVRDDANGKKIGILEDTSEVWIMGSKDGWHKVAWGPNQGWVSAQYLKLK